MHDRGLKDPFNLCAVLWPHVRLYDRQREIVESVWRDDETVVPAANKMGKDFVGGLIVLLFFLTREPCRVVTTSAKADHLDVLWGEIHNFIATSAHPLRAEDGGPLIALQKELRKVIGGVECPKSYVKGMVASADTIAAMQGHHANPDTVEEANDGEPRTLFVSDESSSVPDSYFTMAKTWCKRAYIFGNTWPCENYFKRAVIGTPGTEDSGGDIPRPRGGGFYRKVLSIAATDSPNVQLGLEETRLGLDPTDYMVLPGVRSYSEYERLLATLDEEEQSVILRAAFYQGASLLLFPDDVMLAAARVAAELGGKSRRAASIGIDPGEGGAETALVAGDELGVIAEWAEKTPDTSVIAGMAEEFGQAHGVPPEQWLFDRGGGGKQIADGLRARGMPVRTVAFGESLALDVKRGLYSLDIRRDVKEARYAYKNRRAQMYGEASELVRGGYGIPESMRELRRQLRPIPKMRDGEGRLILPPKTRKDRDSAEVTLTEIIGCSPDRADAFVLMVHGLLHKQRRTFAGAVG